MIRNPTIKMKLFPAILATTSLGTVRPVTTQAFGFGFSDLINRPMVVFPPEVTLFNRESLLADRIFQHSSPRYEITNNEEKFQIAFDVPGLKPEDVHIHVEESRRVLSIEGVSEKTGEGYSFSSKFSQSFTLDPTIEADKFEAQMKDGILLVSAPKDSTKGEGKARTIPISVEGGDSAKTEQLEETSSTSADASQTEGKNG